MSMQPGSPSESTTYADDSLTPTHPADSLSLPLEDNAPPAIIGDSVPPNPSGPPEGNTPPMQSVTSDSDEHDIERKKTKREIMEELKEKTKKARWNVFLFLGIGAILFTFALFPMSTPGFWEANLKSDPTDPTGEINQRVFILGVPETEVKVNVEVWVMDNFGGDIEVYLVPGYCGDDELIFTTVD
ncbi:MAG: nucleolar 14 family protein, partial [Pseudomonadales bacterium]|nr:nucleolar 14 family protein [Pseudomonadales bacterium]